MRFGSTAVVRLKGALRHSLEFSPKKKTVRLAVTGASVKKGGLIGSVPGDYRPHLPDTVSMTLRPENFFERVIGDQ